MQPGNVMNQSRLILFWGYIAGAALMVGAAFIEWTHGVAAERQPLESVSAPLSRL